MTPSLLLTALSAPTPDTTNPLNADCAERIVAPLPAFGVTTTHPTYSGPSSTLTGTPTTSTPSSASECDAYDASSRTNRTLACQWTGAPIRAIVPLPRRKCVLNANAQDEKRTIDNNAPTAPAFTTSTTATVLGLPCHMMRSAHFWGTENEGRDEEEGDQGSGEDRNVASGSRCCSYESITAVEGLSAWSFEELRVECYAQSLVARGTRPPPVVRPSLAIPPAFVPRIVTRIS